MKIGVKYGHNNENIDICIGNQKKTINTNKKRKDYGNKKFTH